MADQFETEWRDHASRFESMDRAQLLHEARKWCWGALTARDERQRVLDGVGYMLTSHERRLTRLWLLADHTRKTIPMDAFLKAFGVGVNPENQENDYSRPPEHLKGDL